jgi:glycosyltransferase involved in cell wall biosynthesis/peptidoglycan/xylan/chitin deacetylase (PgdA/CDA1 family)
MPPEGAGPAVLTYHRICEPRHAPPGLVSATPAAFERQMRWLARTGRAVGLDDVLDGRGGRGVLVTFDDAYGDFAEHAWPVLRALGIPVVLFVPTAFPGSGRAFWWERLFAAIDGARGEADTPLGPLSLRTRRQRRDAYRALRDHVKTLPHDRAMALVDEVEAALGAATPRCRTLSWPELRRLAAEGVALGAHSRTHPLLSRVDEDRAAAEIHGSVEDLQRATGVRAAAFAFPGGDAPRDVAPALREAGIRLAFTTAPPAGAPDPLRMGRINVARRTVLPVFAARIAGPRRAVAPPATPARVAYVMSRFPKLSETFVLAEILAVERRGVQVDLYPLLRERAPLVHPEAAPLVARARYAPPVSPAVVASQLFWLRRRPRAYLRAWRDVLAGTWGSANFFLGALGCFPKVAHAARRMQADGVTHVHCHFANHPAVAGLVIGRLTGIPFSFTAHGSDLHKDRRMLDRKVAEAAFVATVSDDNRRLIVRECGEHVAAKVHVVRAGVDTGLFAPPPDPRAGTGPLRVLCVGTLHEVKGQAHLVEACRLLACEGVAIRCRIVGDGPDAPALRAQIRAAGLGDAVVLAGARTRPEIAAELRQADALVAPSVPTREGRREGIPVVLMEAMSTRVPVVASAISGIPELVGHEVEGLLVPPGDARAIAGALARLAADPALRARLGRAGRRRVLAEFDLRDSAAALARRFGAGAPA